jgi:phospholipase/lecithinase/hemolysin
VLIDFYKGFQDQVAAPAQFGLSNVKTPACPVKAWAATACRPTTSRPARPPPCPPRRRPVPRRRRLVEDYAFSDSFHPTPYGHQLTQQLIAKSLATKGWL